MLQRLKARPKTIAVGCAGILGICVLLGILGSLLSPDDDKPSTDTARATNTSESASTASVRASATTAASTATVAPQVTATTAVLLAATTVPTPADTGTVTLDVNREQERATITNGTDAPVDVSGWVLISEEGDQRYTIPDGTTIEPGAALTITSGENTSGDLQWGGDHVWNNDGDPASLLDASGAEVATD